MIIIDNTNVVRYENLAIISTLKKLQRIKFIIIMKHLSNVGYNLNLCEVQGFDFPYEIVPIMTKKFIPPLLHLTSIMTRLYSCIFTRERDFSSTKISHCLKQQFIFT